MCKRDDEATAQTEYAETCWHSFYRYDATGQTIIQPNQKSGKRINVTVPCLYMNADVITCYYSYHQVWCRAYVFDYRTSNPKAEGSDPTFGFLFNYPISARHSEWRQLFYWFRFIRSNCFFLAVAHGKKRSKSSPAVDAPNKKPRKETESPSNRCSAVPSSSRANVGETETQAPRGSPDVGITEETVRRYLSYKPMTTKDLLKKFKTKKTGLTSEQTVQQIAAILRRIQPEQNMVKGKLYLSLKQN